MTTKRITDAQLDSVVGRINTLLGMPLTPYIDGIPQAGCYHLEHAYNGVNLVRMSMTTGCTGTSNPLYGNYLSKREVYNLMYAFIAGIHARDINQGLK